MPRFAANLSMLYNEHDFLDRFGAAARDGFRGIEYLFPYAYPAAEIKARLDGHGLEQVLFNTSPGDWDAGERGLASLAGREEEFRSSVLRALDYAAVLGNTRIHVMAGKTEKTAENWARYRANLAWAAEQARPAGVTLLVEPINTRDMPGFFLNYQAEAHRLCAEIGAPNLQVQFDLYHCQVMEGDLATTMRRDIQGIGHMQIAGVPQRHEPDLGEVNYPYLFALADELGYAGWIGCEYRPRAGTSAGLGWIRPWQK